MRIFFLSLCILFVTSFAFAQQDSSKRKVSHYLGVQSNQLFRQILNLSNSNTAISNPYLLVYSFNSNNSGCGLNVGFGYNYTQSSDNDDTFTRESTFDNMSLRIGFEKKSSLGKHWLVSWGCDIVADNQKSNTKSTSVNLNSSSTSKSIIETTSTLKNKGFGPRFTLNYRVTEKIILGTECTYYFKTGKNTNKVDSSIPTTIFNPNTGTPTEEVVVSHTDTSGKGKSFQLATPVVLLLIIKF